MSTRVTGMNLERAISYWNQRILLHSKELDDYVKELCNGSDLTEEQKKILKDFPNFVAIDEDYKGKLLLAGDASADRKCRLFNNQSNKYQNKFIEKLHEMGKGEQFGFGTLDSDYEEEEDE